MDLVDSELGKQPGTAPTHPRRTVPRMDGLSPCAWRCELGLNRMRSRNHERLVSGSCHTQLLLWHPAMMDCIFAVCTRRHCSKEVIQGWLYADYCSLYVERSHTHAQQCHSIDRCSEHYRCCMRRVLLSVPPPRSLLRRIHTAAQSCPHRRLLPGRLQSGGLRVRTLPGANRRQHPLLQGSPSHLSHK